MTHEPEPTAAAELESETATLRELLTRRTWPLEKLHRAISDLTDTTERNQRYAHDARTHAHQWPQDTEYAQQWHTKARDYQRAAAIATARAETIREHMKRTTGRSHVHRFAEHPLSGHTICSCGMTPVSAQHLDPDFVTACCGGLVEKDTPGTPPNTLGVLAYCLTCRNHGTLIHRDQWQEPVCAACGKTSAEAGSSVTFHSRTTGSETISAQSCGGQCAEKVEARRKPTGILYRIPGSAAGHLKP